MGERLEALMRIPVVIVSGIILSIWEILIKIFAILNFVIVIITGKRVKEMAEMSEIWNTQRYVFIRYMVFESNQRPFPFEKLTNNISKFK